MGGYERKCPATAHGAGIERAAEVLSQRTSMKTFGPLFGTIVARLGRRGGTENEDARC
jgi:hypothetical protein